MRKRCVYRSMITARIQIFIDSFDFHLIFVQLIEVCSNINENIVDRCFSHIDRLQFCFCFFSVFIIMLMVKEIKLKIFYEN